jgi:hypothetical protein
VSVCVENRHMNFRDACRVVRRRPARFGRDRGCRTVSSPVCTGGVTSTQP